MKSLQSILESLLDSDFDITITIGDVYEFSPAFNLQAGAKPPSSFGGYKWDSKRFWAKYNGIDNAWSRNPIIARKSEMRLEYIKSDIRHGFSMYLLCQPVDFKMTQSNIDRLAAEITKEYCDKSELELEVHVENPRKGHYEFKMWNAMKDPMEGFMGAFSLDYNGKPY